MADLLGPTGDTIASDVEWARTARARARGLIHRDPPHGALILDSARQVHTFGLSYPIDVVFCDREWTVLYVRSHMRPRRVSRIVWRARYVVEMPSASPLAGLRVGDRLAIRS